MADADHSHTFVDAPSKARRPAPPRQAKRPPRNAAINPAADRTRAKDEPAARPRRSAGLRSRPATREGDPFAKVPSWAEREAFLRPHKARRPQTCTVAYTVYAPRNGDDYPHQLPALRLCGQWLHEAGFCIGRTLRIDLERGVLKLTVVPSEPPPSGPVASRV